MRHFTIIPLMLCAASLAQAQSLQWDTDLYGRTTAPLKGIKKGTDIHITSVKYFRKDDENAIPQYRSADHFELSVNGILTSTKGGARYHGAFTFNCVTPQDVWDAAVIDRTLDMITEKGYRNRQRHELEMRSRRYMKLLREHNLLSDDPYLTYYVRTLTDRMKPAHLIDGRTQNIDVVLLQNPAADSYMLPDGTLLVSTGLLTMIHTPDELAAVLAREMVHLVLDHAMTNYRKTRLKQIVIGAVATLVTDVINSFTAFSISPGTEYYSPGTVTSSDVSLVDGIMTAARDELGLEYSDTQDAACDALALHLMKTAGFNTGGLPSVLTRQADVLRNDRKHVRTLERYGPEELLERASLYGTPDMEARDADYEKTIGAAVTSQSQMMYNEHRYREAETLSRQNMDNGICSDDDCIILASSLLAQYNDTTSLRRVLTLTSTALELCNENIQAYRPRILALIKLTEYDKAVRTLNDYSDALQRYLESKKDIISPNCWEPFYIYAVNETGWIRKTQAMLKEKQQNN